jgi:hypothetical protein
MLEASRFARSICRHYQLDQNSAPSLTGRLILSRSARLKLNDFDHGFGGVTMAVGGRWLLVLLTLAVPRSGVCQTPNSITQAACDTDPCFSSVVASCGSCFPTENKTVSPRLCSVRILTGSLRFPVTTVQRQRRSSALTDWGDVTYGRGLLPAAQPRTCGKIIWGKPITAAPARRLRARVGAGHR